MLTRFYTDETQSAPRCIVLNDPRLTVVVFQESCAPLQEARARARSPRLPAVQPRGCGHVSPASGHAGHAPRDHGAAARGPRVRHRGHGPDQAAQPVAGRAQHTQKGKLQFQAAPAQARLATSCRNNPTFFVNFLLKILYFCFCLPIFVPFLHCLGRVYLKYFKSLKQNRL